MVYRMIIIPPDQTIKVEIDDATFWLSPLTSQQRQDLMVFKTVKSGEAQVDTYEMSKRALKYGLKKAKGLRLPDGSEFKLRFEDDGLCDEHCSLLVDASVVVHTLALKLAQGISLETGPGVKVTYEGTKKKTRRASVKSS